MALGSIYRDRYRGKSLTQNRTFIEGIFLFHNYLKEEYPCMNQILMLAILLQAAVYLTMAKPSHRSKCHPSSQGWSYANSRDADYSGYDQDVRQSSQGQIPDQPSYAYSIPDTYYYGSNLQTQQDHYPIPADQFQLSVNQDEQYQPTTSDNQYLKSSPNPQILISEESYISKSQNPQYRPLIEPKTEILLNQPQYIPTNPQVVQLSLRIPDTKTSGQRSDKIQNDVIGSQNHIRGQANNGIGSYNTIIGIDNTFKGDSNEIKGIHNNVKGDHNKIQKGASNIIEGDNNLINNGKDNVIVGGKGNQINGDSNKILDQYNFDQNQGHQQVLESGQSRDWVVLQSIKDKLFNQEKAIILNVPEPQILPTSGIQQKNERIIPESSYQPSLSETQEKAELLYVGGRRKSKTARRKKSPPKKVPAPQPKPKPQQNPPKQTKQKQIAEENKKIQDLAYQNIEKSSEQLKQKHFTFIHPQPSGHASKDKGINDNVIHGFNNQIQYGKDNKVNGDRNFVIGFNNNLKGDYNKIFGGDFNQLSGNHNQVHGECNQLSGLSNVVYGTKNQISGDKNNVRGGKNQIKGQSNKIFGGGNMVHGRGNLVISI